MTAPRRIALALAGGAALSGCGHAAGRDGLFTQGRELFVKAGCGGCHTVASAHTHGQLGPDFDTSERLNRVQIRTEIDLGANGMPSFQDSLTGPQKRAIIEFIFQTMRART